MDASLIVAIVALVLGSGSLLVAAVSLHQSMVGKEMDIRIRAEQRKQEALGYLRQAHLASLSHLSSLQDTRETAADHLGPEDSTSLDDAIKQAESQIGDIEKSITIMDYLRAPNGKLSSYLVNLETRIGAANDLQLLHQQGRADAETLKTEIQRILTNSDLLDDSSS